MAPDPVVSIIIPTLNEEQYVDGLLQSLVSQDIAESIEILVIDGGSTDQTRPRVASIAERAPEGRSVRLLNNPYLFVIKNIGRKVELRSDFHLFYSQNNYVNSVTQNSIDKYLGYENDWLLTFRPNSFTKLDVGVSYAVVTESLVLIKKAGNSNAIPTWAYVSVSFKPQLFKAIFK